mmetsp:Transcript_2658/g.3670  ORF Transcript_2658/g.3670 Transcript_2658/m.3670 type:complete len:91 (+) Transcript_2658:1204-1476(+)|eukprot:CAMPEP_0185599758 /NCGR_PEP_ID=MMETSP0434-20130131/82913_1 /TAXON_ID=626734 ORGANISM="Favella taraikaensis, Strain Fe Narragansett Bay" /NCGR_SAMPLE_ID=MMETSP0434 /ASSEMBLY_ACC=CAM_ASM_000379 /LENGTH=90 /DNA_ID=CAMNT_0028229263 /DNA_START=2299 /DNA_END=2571 /DNA_ORIENTATION=+
MSPLGAGASFEPAPETSSSRIEILDYSQREIIAASLPLYHDDEEQDSAPSDYLPVEETPVAKQNEEKLRPMRLGITLNEHSSRFDDAELL